MDVSKVDRVLHMRCMWDVADGAGDVRGVVGDIRSGAGPLMVRSLVSLMRYTLAHSMYGRCPDTSARIGYPSASKSVSYIPVQVALLNPDSKFGYHISFRW